MNILLPTDGSEFSIEAARACAEQAAKNDDAVVRVISVIETLVPDEPIETASEYYEIVAEASREAAEEHVALARRIILDDPRNAELSVETKTLSGKPDRMIINECEEWPADLVVMGSHGYGFWARTLLGSVSDSVVHHAPCSVLIVRKPKQP
ncbi:MAG: universal stress protein [Acidobacteriota bacterium]|nr:MAG: universal stress protein [Acidobacteriota bacterium]